MKPNSLNKGYGVYQEAQARELDQAKLILMMFAGAVHFLDKALALESIDRMESGKYIARTKNIILELISSLDMDNSGDMGTILLRAYRGLFIKLNDAYFRNEMGKVAEVRASLAELEESWKQVFASPEYRQFKQDREGFRSALPGK